MSLTKIKEPDLITPVNNAVPLIYSSNNSTQDGFKYYMHLDKVGIETIVNMYVYPDISNSYDCVYNASRLLRNYTISNLTDNWNCYQPTKNDNSLLNYSYYITEYIGDTSGTTAQSNNKWAFKGVIQHGETFDFTDYFPNSTSSKAKFLTNYHNSTTLGVNDWDTVNTFYGTFSSTSSYSTDWDRIYIETFTSSYGQSYYIKNTLSSLLPQLVTIPVGPANLNKAVEEGKVYLTQDDSLVTDPIIDTSIVYYEIDLRKSPYASSTDSVSQTITITMNDCDQYKYDGVQFIWLAELGSYESFTFHLKDKKKFKIKRSTYKKNSFYEDDTYIYNQSYTRGYDVYDARSTETHDVVSDWVNDDNMNDKIMELYHSPEVYIIIDDNLYPIIIEDTSVKSMNVKNDKMWSYKLSFSMANEKRINI